MNDDSGSKIVRMAETVTCDDRTEVTRISIGGNQNTVENEVTKEGNAEDTGFDETKHVTSNIDLGKSTCMLLPLEQFHCSESLQCDAIKAYDRIWSSTPNVEAEENPFFPDTMQEITEITAGNQQGIVEDCSKGEHEAHSCKSITETSDSSSTKDDSELKKVQVDTGNKELTSKEHKDVEDIKMDLLGEAVVQAENNTAINRLQDLMRKAWTYTQSSIEAYIQEMEKTVE